MPSIEGIEDKLLIQKFANHRLDIGSMLRELSYLPDNVYLSSLDLDDGNFSLSGVVLAQDRDFKKY